MTEDCEGWRGEVSEREEKEERERDERERAWWVCDVSITARHWHRHTLPGDHPSGIVGPRHTGPHRIIKYHKPLCTPHSSVLTAPPTAASSSLLLTQNYETAVQRICQRRHIPPILLRMLRLSMES